MERHNGITRHHNNHTAGLRAVEIGEKELTRVNDIVSAQEVQCGSFLSVKQGLKHPIIFSQKSPFWANLGQTAKTPYSS
jgi:hypothetical protein